MAAVESLVKVEEKPVNREKVSKKNNIIYTRHPVDIDLCEL